MKKNKKDIISKEIINSIIKELANEIIGINAKNVTLIKDELQRIEDRRADIVAEVDNEYILHIEIQNSNDNSMPLRMMRYYTDIKFHHPNLPIHQYLIYIGKSKLSMKNEQKEEKFTYRYDIINMNTIDCEKLLKIDKPESLILSILCDFKEKNKQKVINHIILKLHEHSKENEKKFREYMIMLEELSKNRNLEKLIEKGEEMLTEINYETLPSFNLGIKKGMEKGMEKGIEKGIKGIYVFEKDPKKIAQIMDIDEKLVNVIITKLNKVKK